MWTVSFFQSVDKWAVTMEKYLQGSGRKAADLRRRARGSTRPSSPPSTARCTSRGACPVLHRRPCRSLVFGNLLSIDRIDMNTLSDPRWGRWRVAGPYHNISSSVVHLMSPSTAMHFVRRVAPSSMWRPSGLGAGMVALMIRCSVINKFQLFFG